MGRHYMDISEYSFLVVDEASDQEIDVPDLIEELMVKSALDLTPKSFKEISDLHTNISSIQSKLQHWIDINKEQLKWPILV